MSILGRIGNRIGSDMRRLPGGNAVGNALGKSPVLGRIPGVRPTPSPIGPSPNGLANAAGPLAGGQMMPSGDMGPMRGPEVPMGPYAPPEGPQNTGITGGMIPPDPNVAKPMMEPQGGIGPDPAALQQMMQKKQMMGQRNQMMSRQQGQM